MRSLLLAKLDGDRLSVTLLRLQHDLRFFGYDGSFLLSSTRHEIWGFELLHLFRDQIDRRLQLYHLLPSLVFASWLLQVDNDCVLDA